MGFLTILLLAYHKKVRNPIMYKGVCLCVYIFGTGTVNIVFAFENITNSVGVFFFCENSGASAYSVTSKMWSSLKDTSTCNNERH